MDDLFSNFRTETNSKSRSSRRNSFEGIFISPEMFIGAVIIFIIAVVLSFSIGIEQGKRIACSQVVVRKSKGRGESIENGNKFQLSRKEKSRKVSVKRSAKVIQGVEAIQNKGKRKGGKYAVQLVVYKDKRYAQREVEYLKKQKYPFFKKVKDGKIIISAGPFANMDEARKAEKDLRRRYKDCFIRLITR